MLRHAVYYSALCRTVCSGSHIIIKQFTLFRRKSVTKSFRPFFCEDIIYSEHFLAKIPIFFFKICSTKDLTLLVNIRKIKGIFQPIQIHILIQQRTDPCTASIKVFEHMRHNSLRFTSSTISFMLSAISACMPTALLPKLSGTIAWSRLSLIRLILSCSLTSFSNGNRMIVGVLNPTPSSNLCNIL